jgi:N-acetylneuraminic acid mutarotase
MNFRSWETCGATPLPRAGCAVAAQADGIVVAGGTYWEDGRKIWSARADRFSPAKGSWNQLPPLPHAIGDAAGVESDRRMHLLGGGTSDSIFNTVWQLTDGGWMQAGELPRGRRSFAAVSCGDELVILGGMTAGPTDYDAATNLVWRGGGCAWATAAPMPGPARLGFAAGYIAGRVVVAGGFAAASGGGVVNLDDILAYDPVADCWSPAGRLPVAVRGVSGLAWAGRGLLIFGGFTDAFSNRIWLLHERSGEVAEVGELPVGVADGRFVWCGGRVVGLTGEDGMRLRYSPCVRTAESTF